MNLFRYLFPAEHKQLTEITMKLDEALETLAAVKKQQEKTVREIAGVQGEVDTLKTKIEALEDAAESGDVPQPIADAILAVKEQAQMVDDAIPDAPPAVPEV